MVARDFAIRFSFSQSDVDTFAHVTGDRNAIHLDEAYAAKSIFKKRIIHGYLGASVFSRIFGVEFPGEGTIYLKQDLKFLAPMFVDQEYTATVTLIEIYKEKKRAKFRTQVSDLSGKITIDGEALIQNEVYG